MISPAVGQILKDTQTQAIKTAIFSGQLAGAGYFCDVDSDSLDELITSAYAKIAIQSFDKVDRVVAQLEFSNNYSAWSAREPAEGCNSFRMKFAERYNRLFQKK